MLIDKYGNCKLRDCDQISQHFAKYNTKDNLNWNIIRLVWIGFNSKHCKSSCLISKLPKDIVDYIISYIGRKHVIILELMQIHMLV